MKASFSQKCDIYPYRLPLATVLNWYCLPVLETLVGRTDEGSKRARGLVLLKTRVENEYRRVDLFHAYLGGAEKLFRRPTYPFRKANSPEAIIRGLLLLQL
jgi:hypothetical protein